MLGVTAFVHRKRGKINNAENMVVAMNIFQLFNHISMSWSCVFTIQWKCSFFESFSNKNTLSLDKHHFKLIHSETQTYVKLFLQKVYQIKTGKKIIVSRCLGANGAAISMNSLMYLPGVACSYDVGLCHFHLHFLANITNISQYWRFFCRFCQEVGVPSAFNFFLL